MIWYLYRKAGRCVILALAAALLTASAPGQSRKKESGPRALAVIEFPKDPKGSPRLIPIAILDSGHFYDASVYLATPRPLAVGSSVVYEAERSGESVGLFTVEGARQVNGEWIALGHWHPNNAPAPKSRAAKSERAPEEDEKPPVLRRPGAPSDDTQTPPSSGSPTKAPDTSNPAPPAGSSVPAPASAPASAAESAPPPSESDSGHPILRRGKPQASHEDAEFDLPAAPAAAKTAGGAGPQGPADVSSLFKEVLPAISDAGGPKPRSFAYAMTGDDQQQFTRKMAELASAELIKYARAKPGLKAPPAATFDQVSLRAFDIDGSNNPVLVFTARAPGAAARAGARPADYFYYVTEVARQESGGELRKLYSTVTDTGHLDAFPRLEMVDAVDAEGNERGTLLFRAISDTGRGYQLYRVTRDVLWKLFEGGSGAQ